MGIAFVHLSDIHFGQEKGGLLHINNDAKAQLIEDVRAEVRGLPGHRAAGLIVTGDIAYGGLEQEYAAAAEWLDKVAAAAGCDITDVQLVPGNHDIDWNEITPVCDFMLSEIKTKGELALDQFLADEDERALLYRRFRHFMPFADGYRCPLDLEGGQIAERVVHLAPGRSIRFVRLNSALVCGKKDGEGTLLLGARQRVMHPLPGEELIVLSHHPLNWFQDGVDAGKFIRSRARLLITGHEHNPSVKPEAVEAGCDILMIAAGATVPPHVDHVYTYNYNLIEFDWNEPSDSLTVQLHPRTWNDERKRFEADDIRLGGASPSFTLGCPNFRAAPRIDAEPAAEIPLASDAEGDTVVIPNPVGGDAAVAEPVAPDPYALIVLRFFRDIGAKDRIALLVELGALPEGWIDTLPHAHERLALDSVIKKGRGEELAAKIDAMIDDKK